MRDYDARCRQYHNLCDLSVDELQPGDCHFSIDHNMQRNWTCVVVSIVKRGSVVDITWIECDTMTQRVRIAGSQHTMHHRFPLYIYRSSVQ